MQNERFHLVFVGHIDHGKSTLIGRLLYDTESIPEEKLEEIKKLCKELNIPLEFAYITDALEEERKKKITIDTTQTFFKSSKREYVIIDAPGHKEFLKNMVTGASYADAAILIVDAEEGIKEQTKRHSYILHFLGIDQLIVVVNKMDKINWSKDVFEDIKKDILEYLQKFNIHPEYVIPISALLGDNVVKYSQKLSWYEGPTVLEALDSFELTQKGKFSFRMPVQLKYNKDGKTLLLGSIISGEVKKGDSLMVCPPNKSVKVLSISKMNYYSECAYAHEAIALEVSNSDTVERGMVLCKGNAPITTKNLRASVIALKGNLCLGDEIDIFVCTQKAKGVLSKIHGKLDIETLTLSNKNEIEEAEIGEVEILLNAPIVIEKHNVLNELGRFVIKKNGRIVGGGIIL